MNLLPFQKNALTQGRTYGILALLYRRQAGKTTIFARVGTRWMLEFPGCLVTYASCSLSAGSEMTEREAQALVGIVDLLAFTDELDTSTLTDVVAPFKTAIDSPAARQMLICHYSAGVNAPGPSPDYAWLPNYFRTSVGYPAQCRKIAISNGSGGAMTHPFAPGDSLLYIESHALLFSSYFNLFALPQSGQPSTLLFDARFNPLDLFNQKDFMRTIHATYPVSLDNAPGGVSDTFAQLDAHWPALLKWPGSRLTYGSHCFIPVTSSIGISSEFLHLPLVDRPDIRALSPFDEIYFAAQNEPHIDINAHNKRHFLKAILQAADSDNDGFDDYAEHLAATDLFDASDFLRITSFSLSPATLTIRFPARAERSYQILSAASLALPVTPLPNTRVTASDDTWLDVSFPRPESTSGFFKLQLISSDDR